MVHHPRIEMPKHGLPPLTFGYQVISYDNGQVSRGMVTVCREEPVRLVVNGHSLVTQMMSPADLAEFACGYLISEGIVGLPEQIEVIRISLPDIEVTVTGFDERILSRAREIRTSGGIGLAADPREIRKQLTPDTVVHRDTIFSAMACLNDHAVLWRETGGTHCTVLFDTGGDVVAHAEDMGRHTSVDKVIGKALLSGTDTSRTFISCSGRMPAGMVGKIWRSGIPIVVTNNAPSASGIDLARQVNLTLAGFVRPPRMVIYSSPDRIQL